jgi:hypothetical protein
MQEPERASILPSMIGAGIFALLGEAGAAAKAAG